MSFETLSYASAGRIVRITPNRPERLSAMVPARRTRDSGKPIPGGKPTPSPE